MGTIETLLNTLLDITPIADDGFWGSSTGNVGSTITPGGITPL